MGEFLLHGVTFRVVCLYAPNKDTEREEFLDYCVDHVDPVVIFMRFLIGLPIGGILTV